jgi:hypothetical protein
VERERLSAASSEQLPLTLRINSYLEEVANLAHEINLHRSDIEKLCIGDSAESIHDFMSHVRDLFAATDPTLASFDHEELEDSYDQLRGEWHSLKTLLLNAAAHHLLPISSLNVGLDRLRACLRIAEQLIKASTRVHNLNTTNQPQAIHSQ